MFRVFAEFQGNTLITELPHNVYDLRDEFSSIGYTEPLSKIPVMMDDDDELEIQIYPDEDLEQAVFGKIAKGDTLLQLNTVARYLESRSYFLDAEEVKKYDVSGLSEVYKKLSEPRKVSTTNMVLYANLVRKAEDFTPSTCIDRKSVV